MALESLERRAMLAIDATFAAGVLTLDYNQPDAGGLVTTTNQNAVIEIEELGPSAPAGQTVRVNLYRSSNPGADAYLGVTKIVVNVPNFDLLGVNNNSLTIKGLESPEDRIVMAGSGRTAAGRWYDQLPSPDQNQILFEITGVDNLTLTAGGTINVSGSFTNDTDDASITVIGTSLETDENRTEYPNQHTATIVLGESTPVQDPGVPAARLFSNAINVIGGSIEINSDIEAAGEVSLKVSDLGGEPTNLVLPYNITVSQNPRTGNPGRLDLISPRNVVQQATSVITASVVNVVADDTFGPVADSVVDLSTPQNDFDTISIQTGTALQESRGSVAIRDIDDLVICSNDLLATTGLLTVHTGGLLTIDTPIFASGFKAYSGFGILSTDQGSLTIGDGGIDLTAKAVAANATGDITLNGRVEIGDFDLPAVIINNAIRADGIVSVAGGFFAPQAGVTMVEGFQGIVIASPVQVGNTFLNETSTNYVVTDADLTLVSSNGFVDILDFSGNSAIPQAVQVTNMLAIDAFGDIFIDGLVFAGTRYGDVLALTETDALPNISIRGQADITIGTTGRLETSSYETNADTHVNPLVGAITITDASQFTNFGRIDADGALEVNVKGDVYLTGSVTARESINVETDLGIIDIQGAVETTGFSYATTPPEPLLDRRTPTISLSAPSGSITTSLLGTMSAGSLLGGVDPIRGEIRLYAQQDISIGADIDTDGAVIAESKLGGFNLDALLRAGNDERVEIQAATGITEFEFGRIQTALLDATITEGVVAADIVLPALGNRILALQARNFTPGGSVELFTDSILDIQRIETRGDVEITATGTVGVTGLAQSLGGSLEIVSQGGGLNVQSTILAPQGGVSLSATGQIVQRGGNVVTIFLLSGGRDYSFANVTLDPPPGAGDVALATAVITPYAGPPFGTGNGISGVISDIIILDGGWGYPSDTRVGVKIDGDGEGASAVAETSIVTSSIEARDDVVLRAGDGVTLVSAVRSAAGKVDISATLGTVSVQSITAGSDVDVTAERGEITLVTVSAQGDVTLAADQGLTVNDSLNSFGGDVVITTTNGDLEFNTDLLTGPGLESVIYTAVGDVSLTSVNGRIVTPYTINSQGDVSLTSFNTLELTNEITSQAGDILAWSTSGRIDLTANLVAEQGSISLEAQTSFRQDTITGVRSIELLAGGPVLDEPPEVTVTVAPPSAAGGRAATAAAITQRRAIQAAFGNDDVEYEYFIQSIVVLDAGRGYAVGEDPLVTVTGVPGVVARAFGPNAFQMVTAQGDISLDVGEDVALVSDWLSVTGDIVIKSKTGDLDLSASRQLVHAVDGNVLLSTTAGSVSARQVRAGENIDVSALLDIDFLDHVNASRGDVTVRTTSGDLSVQDRIHAEAGSISLTASDGTADITSLQAGKAITVNVEGIDPQSGFSADVSTLVAGTSLTVTALGSLNVLGEQTARTGDISLRSRSGAIDLAYSDLHAIGGSVSIDAHGQVRQALAGSLLFVDVVNQGAEVSANQPEVTVTIAAPAGGGRAATAIATVERIGFQEEGGGVVITPIGGVVVIPTNATPVWGVTRVELIDRGAGYATEESLEVTIEGIAGASALAFGPSIVPFNIVAQNNVAVQGGETVTLTSIVRSNTGDISVRSIDGDLDLSALEQLVHAVAGDVVVSATAGAAALRQVRAGGDIDVETLLDTTFLDHVNAAAGDVTVRTISGDLLVQDRIHAEAGSISLTASDGTATVATLQSGKAISVTVEGVNPTTGFSANLSTFVAGTSLAVTTLGSMTIAGEQTARAGDITYVSRSGAVDLSFSDVHAIEGAISIAAHGEVRQSAGGGIFSLIRVNEGRVPADAAPEVTVTIAPPADGGGRAATAVALVGRNGWQTQNGEIILSDRADYIPLPTDVPTWGVFGYELVDRGAGYAPGETPLVTVTGLPGASAVAFGPGGVPLNIVADQSIDVVAGERVFLTGIVRSNKADVTITSIDRDVDLGGADQLVHTLVGDISLKALAGAIRYNDLQAGGSLTLQSFAPLAIDRPLVLNGQIDTKVSPPALVPGTGNVTLASTGHNVALTANVLAADRLAISAKTGIAQTDGVVKATDLYAENLTPTGITLAAAGNDVERFAAKNVGNVTFNDANDFRVGLQTSGTMGVEVTGDSVTFNANGTIRVVAGIEAGTLVMVSDTVELATTNAADNPNAAFSGTFRDMIAISNANTDRTSAHEFVFDELGYSVAEVDVKAALPALTRRAIIDGSTADGGRLGIRGSTGVASGVRFGAGSAGSQLTTAALYGFSSGSAFVIDSSANSVSDLWFGLRADGSAPALNQRNRVGVNVTGSGAFGNVIGSALEFDPATANRFAGHTDAAIVVQRGASNNLVAGNLVGGDGMAANRTGIRIDGGSGNRIGTPDQVSADLTPTPSNRIVGNTHYGIEVRNVRGATTLIENNIVSGNATATGSGSHGIGVLNSAFVQIGGTSELSRNQVFSNLGGSGIHLSGSNNVRIVGNAIGTDGYHLSANGQPNDYDASRPDLGNGMHGIHVFGRSRDVLIDANRIVDNGGSGVAIASGSAAVNLTNNEIGVWVHPVTGNVHAAGNDADGVTITAANGNTIGAGNQIGFNRGSGVRVENSVAAGLATGNRVTGVELFGNLGHGVHLTGSSRQTVGGVGEGAGNVVMENGLDGIRIETDPRIRASAAPQGNVVAGNFVGTNPNEEIDRGWGNRAGIAVMNGNQTVLSGNVVMNNRASGIEISGGSGNTVGGQVATAGNFVGYNLGDGIFIHDQASTNLPVGVVGTTITNQGAGYSASRTTVIFTAPVASGGVAARGVAIISAAGRVTGIQLTSKGSGYVAGEPVTVTIFDPQATVQATATVSLGVVEAVSQLTRGHVVSGNEIEANNGIGIYVKGDRTTEIQIGQDFDSRTGRGLGNTLSYHDVAVLVEAAGRVSVQGNAYGDNAVPVMMLNGANSIPGAEGIQITDLKSVAWGKGQTRVTGTVVGGGAYREYWVDVYATPYYDMDYDNSGNGSGHQMRTFLGRTLVTTDATGRAAISLTVSESMGLGDHVSVTLTSNRHEDGSTVGIWHSPLAHGIDLTASPTSGSPTVTPSTSTTSTTSSGSTSTGGRGPVPVRG